MQRHPFDRIFLAAAKRSAPRDNQVAAEAEALLLKGYPREEVAEVLRRLGKTFIDPKVEHLFIEALEVIE